MMIRTLATLALVALSGCTSVMTTQSDCERQHPEFSGMAACLKQTIAADRRLSANPSAKLYVLKADQLAAMVARREIDEPTARLTLQELLVKLRREEIADINDAVSSMPKTVRTNCSTVAGITNCTSR